MLEAFGPSLYLADGPTVSFFGLPFPTRMALARLADGSVWVWSPIALSVALAREVDAIGPVRQIVSPNKLHHLFLNEWAARWPDARLHAPVGLASRRRDVRFHAELGDSADPAWAGQIDQLNFAGSITLTEAVFFHRPSRTAIVGDLVQRHDPARLSGLRGLGMRLIGIVGDRGSTPREFRASFLRHRAARASRARVLGWQPERLVIAHGKCAERNGAQILERALSWI